MLNAVTNAVTLTDPKQTNNHGLLTVLEGCMTIMPKIPLRPKPNMPQILTAGECTAVKIKCFSLSLSKSSELAPKFNRSLV